MVDTDESQKPRYQWLSLPVPGMIGRMVATDKLSYLRELDANPTPRLWTVKGVVSDHVQLAGDPPRKVPSPIQVRAVGPIPVNLFWMTKGMHLHLQVESNRLGLTFVTVRVKTDRPLRALTLARPSLNYFLDTVSAAGTVPLTYGHLELASPHDDGVLIRELIVPYPIVPIDQGLNVDIAEPFLPADALFREAVTSGSPYYKLLCGFRLYDFIVSLRRQLKTECAQRKIEARIPKLPRVDLQPWQFPDDEVQRVKNLEGLKQRLTDFRDGVAHAFIGERDNVHLFVSGAEEFYEYSRAASVLLFYSKKALDDLRAFYVEHLHPKMLGGFITQPLGDETGAIFDPSLPE